MKMSKSQSGFLERARRIASTSTCRIKHGSVVVKSGNVIGVGVNSYRMPFMNPALYTESTEGISTHAEAAAIKAAGDCKGATIYVARVRPSGEDGMSAPCKSCQKIIVKAGIKKVVYTVG